MALMKKKGNVAPPPAPKKKKKSKLKLIGGTILSLFILVACVGACGGDENVKVDDSMSVETEGKTKKKNVEITLEKQVLYEGNGVVITAKSIEKKGRGYDVNILIENNSDLNLSFNAHASAINGIMTGNSIFDMRTDVAAGKKANTSLNISSSIMTKYGIESIRCVDVLFWAYDSDDVFKSFDTGQVEIKTNLYNEKHDTITGKTIYSDEYVTIDYLSNDKNEFNFRITNNTNSYINFDFNEVTINDFTSSDIDFDLYDEIILKDCQAVITVKARRDFLEENGIEEIKTIEWNMSIRQEGDYFKESKIGPIVYNVE